MERKQLRINMSKGLVLFFLLNAGFSLKAQQLSKDYTPLKSSGSLPEVFLKSAQEQSDEEIKKLSADREKQTKQQFILANNYFIQDLLLSGQVLVNDPLTNYVNKVAAEVIEQNPGIGSQSVKIFVTKSPDVNAYAFDKGFIFVNIGLLAQLENEAQLAYVLAHELVHVNKKHSVTEYLENKRNEKDIAADRAEAEDKILTMYRFSKEQETDADMTGLDLIKKTNYSTKAIMGAFDVMQYSYLPFELPEFKKSFLEDENLKIPDTLNLKKTSAIKANDDYDDSKSSHPNIRKRRMAIDDDVKNIADTGRKKYLVSEEEFKSTREIARFELCRIYLLRRDYINAIYAAYILLQKYPDNLYLKKIVSKSLYNITVSKSGRSGSNYVHLGNASSYTIENYENIEGASQRLYYLFDHLTAKEANVISLSYVYKASKQFPGDKTLSLLTDSLFSCLVNSNNLYLNDFSRKTLKEANDTTKKIVVAEAEPVEESKYATIKRLQASEEQNNSTGFIKYAFVDQLKDDDFVKRFRKAAKGKDHETSDDYVSSKKKTTKNSKSINDELLGIDKVIFLDPYYKRVKRVQNDIIVKYEESDEKQQKLMETQKKCADMLALKYETISAVNLSATDMARYNEIALINEWLTERFRHGDDEEFMECSESMKELIAKQGTKYIALTGIYNSNKKDNTYVFMLLDLETGKVRRSEIKTNHSKDANDLVHSYVYNSLFHVVKKPKN